MEDIQRLKADYPWIKTPLVVGAPMRLIALADMAVEISKAGGIGFIGAGTDVSDLESHLQKAQSLLQQPTSTPTSTTSPPPPPSTNTGTLPIGIGFINWGASLQDALPVIHRYRPAATWFFAPSTPASLHEWIRKTQDASPATKIWVQVGSVAEAQSVMKNNPDKIDVLVVQGTDAGGHGLAQGASLISLFPEARDAVGEMCGGGGGGGNNNNNNKCARPVLMAAGGISESRGAASALVLGASGVVMGTRFLASQEANIAKGYRDEVVRASDGGQTTVRTKVYDVLRGTTGWAESHNGRGVVNRSYWDAVQGVDEGENKKLYKLEEGKGDVGWGPEGRMTTYAGTGIGLVREVKAAGQIVEEIRNGVVERLGLVGAAYLDNKEAKEKL